MDASTRNAPDRRSEDIDDLQTCLELELERLKKILKIGYELRVRWIPTNNRKISGEVRGNYILVYDQDSTIALETLTHEFIDHAVSKVIEPYKEMTNRLIDLLNEHAYERKESLVESFCRLLREGRRQ